MSRQGSGQGNGLMLGVKRVRSSRPLAQQVSSTGSGLMVMDVVVCELIVLYGSLCDILTPLTQTKQVTNPTPSRIIQLASIFHVNKTSSTHGR